jgi:hypothetical protein
MALGEPLYPHQSSEVAIGRTRPAPGPAAAFRAFRQTVFAAHGARVHTGGVG